MDLLAGFSARQEKRDEERLAGFLARQEERDKKRDEREKKRDEREKKRDKLLDKMSKQLDCLETRTSSLCEEKARNVAKNMFGDSFSKRLLIKSIYEVVKLIAKADDPDLPKDHNIHSRMEAVGKVALSIKPSLPFFVQAAHRALVETSNSVMGDQDGFKDAKEKLRNATKLLSSGSVDYKMICGLMLEVVKGFGTKDQGGNETEEDRDKRIKETTGKFKRTLERLKKGFDEGGLEDCDGSGIMICLELSMVPKAHRVPLKWEQWIEEHSDIRNWNEEVECDIRGSVMLVGGHALISVGEIKTSIKYRHDAVVQMTQRGNLIEFVLQNIFDCRFDHVVKKGHLFVLESSKNNQTGHQQTEDDLSVFVHRIDSM
jgi:hypothetical protein